MPASTTFNERSGKKDSKILRIGPTTPKAFSLEQSGMRNLSNAFEISSAIAPSLHRQDISSGPESTKTILKHRKASDVKLFSQTIVNNKTRFGQTFTV